MKYDEAIGKLEEIVRQLENSEGLSMQEYNERAAEATKLLEFCRQELKKTTETKDDTDQG